MLTTTTRSNPRDPTFANEHATIRLNEGESGDRVYNRMRREQHDKDVAERRSGDAVRDFEKLRCVDDRSRRTEQNHG